MRLGVFGGTFDPFHRGHVDPVLAAQGELRWDRVVYVPAFRQPFKTGQQTISPFHRFAMTVLGTRAHELMYVSPMELDRGDISYSVDTLEILRSEHPIDTIDWIIGDDNLPALPLWRKLDRILELANFVVLTRLAGDMFTAALPDLLRPHVSAADTRPFHGAVVSAHNPNTTISSTEIRQRLHAGQPVDDLVDPSVSRYIQHHGLYQGALFD